jgi:hypothetical protein
MPLRSALLPVVSLPCGALPGLVGEAGWVMQHCVCDLSNKFVLHPVRVAAAGNTVFSCCSRCCVLDNLPHATLPFMTGQPDGCQEALRNDGRWVCH